MAGIAYEGVQLENGARPILQTMSKIAGERAVKEGLRYLAKNPKDTMVVILGGAGAVGQSAIQAAQSLNASVIALDLPGKMEIRQTDNYQAVASTPENIKEALKKADLIVGAVAIPGGKAAKLVSKDMLSLMKPNSVIVDVAIDEGGCVETSKPTTNDNPTFVSEGIIHYCVKNMPGAVPQVSTPALTASTLSYILEIASNGLEKAAKENPALLKGLHVYGGKITNQRLAETLNENYTPPGSLL